MEEVSSKKLIDKSLLDACIHCGMCLPACPTYLATGREVESPRGRIALLSAWQNGTQEFSPRLAEHIDSCLGCLGCQTACPSGVQYEKILNAGRPQLAEMRSPGLRNFLRFCFAQILPNYVLLSVLGFFLLLWQKLGGRALLQTIVRLMPQLEPIARSEAYSPPVGFGRPLPRQIGTRKSHYKPLQFFRGCIMDIFYNHVNHASLDLLSKQKLAVSVPNQTCCGALAFHAGEVDIARRLARENIEKFDGPDADIVVTSAGCGAMLKEYPELFEHESEWHARAEAFAKRVKDISEVLARHQAEASVSNSQFMRDRKVAYHAACHLAHAQGVRQEPSQLLENLANQLDPPFELVPLREAEHCCGSAGIYNLLHMDLSDQILDRKLEHIATTGAEVVVTSNPGCLLQLNFGFAKKGMKVRAEHLAEFLNRYYR